MFLDQGPIAMSVLFIVIALQLALFRTKWGLRTRAVGEHPKAADAVGIDVYRQRYPERDLSAARLRVSLGRSSRSNPLVHSRTE